MHQIKNMICEKKEKELDKLITEVEVVKCNNKMYKAVKLLSRKPFENPYK